MSEISIIVKPTIGCNVQCKHCAVRHSAFINRDYDFYVRAIKVIMEFRKNYLVLDTQKVEVIWHGGEPMLLGPDFYENVSLALERSFPFTEFEHSMQTNLLLYNHNRKWKQVFQNIFNWRISSSYDFFSSLRPYPVEKFLEILRRFQDDSSTSGYVICVLSRENYKKVVEICEIANEWKFNLRLNYLYHVGSAVNLPSFSPEMYREALLSVVKERSRFPGIKIDPIDFFAEFKKGTRKELPCPYTTRCGETIFAVYPDGRIFNCAELADLDYYSYGDVDSGINPEIFTTLQLQKVVCSFECIRCGICGGGCLKQRILGRSISSRTPYCSVWRSIFEKV